MIILGGDVNLVAICYKVSAFDCGLADSMLCG